MQETQNTKLIQDAYGDFGRGDVASLIARLDAGVVWHAVIGASPKVPTAGVRKGPAAVAEFFETLAQSIAFTRFEPREFIAQGNKVVVLGFYSGSSISTGRAFASEWVMVFTVKNGKVTGFKEFTDSAQLNAAFD
jgi:uncharacterized protein